MSVIRSFLLSRRRALLLVATVTFAACRTFSGSVHTPDERHFPDLPRHVDKAAVIEISAPQIYSRESLINDRRDEQDYLEELLAASRKVHFPPELARDLSTITALALDLGLAFDPTKALEYDAAKDQLRLASDRERLELQQELENLEMRAEARELQHQVDLTKLEIELEKLKQQLEQLRADGDEADGEGGESSEGSGSSDGGSEGAASSFPEVEVPESRLKELREVTDSLLQQLRTRTDLPRKATVETDPREEFRARQAYRQDLRAALAEARLDDVHDQRGQALYRLQFQATVAPGEYKGKWGVARLTLDRPEVEAKRFFAALYRTWLGHATYRLNQAETHRTGGAGERITDPLYRSLAVGSNAFSIRSIFYDPAEDRLAVVDRCDDVLGEREASLRGCKSFLLAMPLLADEALGSPIPGIRAIMLGFLVDRLKEYRRAQAPPERVPRLLILVKVRPDDQDRTSLVGDLINDSPSGPGIHKVHIPKGVCAARFMAGEDSWSHEPAIRNIRNIVELGKWLEKEEWRSQSAKAGVSESPPSSQVPANGDGDYLLVQQYRRKGRVPNGKQLQDVLGAEKKIAERAFALARGLPLSDWFTIFPPGEALRYAIAVLNASRPAAASLQGLTSRRDLSPVEREKITLLLRGLTEAAHKAREFIGSLWDLNNCEEEKARRWEQKNLWPSWDYQERGGDLPYEFFRALARDGAGCWSSFREPGDSTCILKGRASVHATAPEQLSQQVSTVSSATRALQLAASIAGSLPAEGAGAEAALGLAKGATGQVEALERVPLVVGFSGDRVPGAKPKDPGGDSENGSGDDPTNGSQEGDKKPENRSEFGWVFGPRATVDTENDEIQLTQTLSTYTVTADLLVPGWWPRVEMDLETGWVGNWHDAELLNLKNGGSRRIKKDLPLNRADLDNLTAVMAEEILGQKLQQTEIYDVYPNRVSLCNDEITLLIYGANVWRSTEIYLGGLRTKEASIRVLPDMEGVSARFDLTRLAKRSSQQKSPSLVVWTQSGFDSRDLELTGAIGKDGKCTDLAPQPKAPRRIITVSPSSVSRCSDSVTFAVETASFEADAAFLGSEAHMGITRKPATVSPSDKTVGYLIRFTNLTGKNKGLDAWPLTLVANDGKVLNAEIAAVGSAKDCSRQPAIPAPSLKPALPEEGALNVCVALDSVTLIGSGADKVTKATFLGFTSSGVEHPSKDTAVISFPNLPRFAKPEEVPAKAELRFFAGGKDYSLEVQLRCKK